LFSKLQVTEELLFHIARINGWRQLNNNFLLQTPIYLMSRI